MRYFKDILNLFYAKICVCCNSYLVEGEQEICLACLTDLPFTNFSCESKNVMEQMFDGRIPLVYGTSLLYYQPKGKTQDLIFALKYHGQQRIGILLANLLFVKMTACDRFPDIDMIIPVPLHNAKLKKRGYNQLSTFGEGLSKLLNIPYHDHILFRKKASYTQTKKNRRERQIDLDELFFIQNVDLVNQKHILLIDDVLTTGATLEACALALLKGQVKISIATMAFTD